MNKSTYGKLIFTFLIILISFSLIQPFEDQELGGYALSQVSSEANSSNHTGHENFAEVIDNLRNQLPEDQPIDYGALRSYGKRNRLDYAAFFSPPEGVLGTVGSRIFPVWVKPGIRSYHVKDRDKRNDLVLRTLLKNSQAAIKRGLDLRGGIAFTMEITDANESDSSASPSGATPMDKVIEIMSERLNAFGVAETLVRKKGDNAIEIQIPDRTTKQDPGIIEELQKPAKLEFRVVNVNADAPIPLQEGEEWTDDEGIPYVAMMRSDAVANERPIWVKRLWSADGDIIEEAYAKQDQMGGWEVGLDFTSDGGKIFGDLTGEIANANDPTSGALGRLAIVLDGQLESAPTVKQRIDGGSAVINGNFSFREAKMLSDILNNPLKVSLTIGEKYEVSPTLAAGALSSSLNACLLGAVLIIAFMITWYKAGGIVAVLSVGTNILLVIAVLVENIRRVASYYRYYKNDQGKKLVFAKPFYELVNNELILRQCPPAKEPIEENDLPNSEKKKIDTGGRLILLRKLAVKAGIKDLAQKIIKYQPIPEYNSATNPVWLIMRKILENWIIQHQKPVILMPIPLYQHVEETCDASAYQDRFQELSESTGCILHDPLIDLLKYTPEQRRKFRFERDIHLTPEGHEAIAASVAPVVKKILLTHIKEAD